jgi:hypothetical protein
MLNSFGASLAFALLFMASVSALLFLLAWLEPRAPKQWGSSLPAHRGVSSRPAVMSRGAGRRAPASPSRVSGPRGAFPSRNRDAPETCP